VCSDVDTVKGTAGKNMVEMLCVHFKLNDSANSCARGMLAYHVRCASCVILERWLSS
jgi:hypothetical protein